MFFSPFDYYLIYEISWFGRFKNVYFEFSGSIIKIKRSAVYNNNNNVSCIMSLIFMCMLGQPFSAEITKKWLSTILKYLCILVSFKT